MEIYTYWSSFIISSQNIPEICKHVESRPLFSVVNWKCRRLSFDIKSFLLYVTFQVVFSDHVMDYLGWHQCFSLNIVSMDTLPCVWCFVWVIFRRSGTWQLYYEDVSSIPLPVHYCIAYWFSEWIYVFLNWFNS